MTRLPLILLLLAMIAGCETAPKSTAPAEAPRMSPPSVDILAPATWAERTSAVVLTIEESGAARKLTYRTRAADGSFMKGEMSVVTMGDGADAPMMYDGKPMTRTLAIRKLDANRLQTVVKLNGKVCGTWKSELSADGKTMRGEDEYTDAACGPVGKKFPLTWDRK